MRLRLLLSPVPLLLLLLLLLLPLLLLLLRLSRRLQTAQGHPVVQRWRGRRRRRCEGVIAVVLVAVCWQHVACSHAVQQPLVGDDVHAPVYPAGSIWSITECAT